MQNQLSVNITLKSILLVILVLIFFYFIGNVLGLVFLFLLAYILASALRPMAKSLQKLGLPSSLSSILVFMAFFLVLVSITGLLIPVIAEQARSIYEKRSEIVQSLEFAIKALPPTISEGVINYAHTLPKIFVDYLVSPRLIGNILGILAGVGGLILFIIVTVFILIEQSSPANLIKKYWPKETKDIALSSFEAFEIKISQWIRGQVFLSILVGILSYIGLRLLGVPYAELLAVITSLMGLVPYIGPWISGFLASVVALTISPVLALYVVLLYFGVQQLESAVLVPKVMKRAVNLSPVSILFIITTGVSLFGVLGAIVAIPLTAGVKAAADVYLGKTDA